MKLTPAIRSFLTRKPTLLAVAGVGALGLLGGTALALDGQHGHAAAAPAPAASASPSCSPTKGARAHHAVAPGKVTAVDATSITIQGLGGKALTFSITGKTVVRGPKKAPLSLQSVHVGDYVVVAHGRGANANTAAGIVDIGSVAPRKAAHKPVTCPTPTPG